MHFDRVDKLVDVSYRFLLDLFECAEKAGLLMPAVINVPKRAFAKKLPNLEILNGSFIDFFCYLTCL